MQPGTIAAGLKGSTLLAGIIARGRVVGGDEVRVSSIDEFRQLLADKNQGGVAVVGTAPSLQGNTLPTQVPPTVARLYTAINDILAEKGIDNSFDVPMVSDREASGPTSLDSSTVTEQQLMQGWGAPEELQIEPTSDQRNQDGNGDAAQEPAHSK